MELYDVTIIGGGPAGLYSAFYSGLRTMKTKILEFQPELGGKVNIYPEKMLWDIGGQPPIQAQYFIKNLIEQAQIFSPTICLNTKVDTIKKEEKYFVIETATGEKHYSKTIIVAVGGGILSPIKLDIEGAEKYEMTNLHYTILGLERFRDKSVLVSGGGNGAIDWAVELLYVAKEVTVVYRKDQLTAHEAQIEKLKQHGVTIMLNAEIQTVLSNREKTAIEQVIIDQNGEKHTLTVDDVLISHGYNRETSLTYDEKNHPDLKDDYYLMSEGKCKTSVPGIFGAGDIISYDDKVNLLVGTFQDAVLAVNSAKLYIEPEANAYGMVSSHNDMFNEKNRKILEETFAKQ
ncbi:thioredoxin reductase [Lysinibacillus sp. 2017]|uniref:NAD(P)/FAD-dependent oxidoreductase n=1 Tax=unclassified Lysinibacillus TaxID=2636778 RepID=UPI000D529A5A|nr:MULTISPECIES: NAD(P)/FAD-dependent oxidoreductase [unclassified Lysinibacillus]AWE06200.1 thioredoxin reductase [Lysinibacillus sp. 2017]TGN35148.1 NAD(P)/FAD-dependent oxidoreductase [Lysinibacillus sp. S2017]